jgi:hypothetical protein
MPKNFGQKGLTKVVKIYVKITPNFVSKGSKRCQKRYYGVKNGDKLLSTRSRRMYTGFSQCRVRLLPVVAVRGQELKRAQGLAGWSQGRGGVA